MQTVAQNHSLLTLPMAEVRREKFQMFRIVPAKGDFGRGAREAAGGEESGSAGARPLSEWLELSAEEAASVGGLLTLRGTRRPTPTRTGSPRRFRGAPSGLWICPRKLDRFEVEDFASRSLRDYVSNARPATPRRSTGPTHAPG